MPSTVKYGILGGETEHVSGVRISFGTLSCATLSLPLVAFAFCVLYSVAYNFESATHTHCNVYNALPSLSAAIGNFTPQKEVWQLAILLQAVPRFYVAGLYWQLNQTRLHPRDLYLSNVVLILNVLEVVSLLILSFWTSSKFYAVHEKAFVTFIIASVAYMVLTCLLQSKHRVKENRDKLSVRLKKRFAFVNVLCIFIAGYFFVRHNSLCEPYVYTWFALSEYVVVLTNMCYHMTAYLDFKSKDLILYKCGVRLCDKWEYFNY